MVPTALLLFVTWFRVVLACRQPKRVTPLEVLLAGSFGQLMAVRVTRNTLSPTRRVNFLMSGRPHRATCFIRLSLHRRLPLLIVVGCVITEQPKLGRRLMMRRVMINFRLTIGRRCVRVFVNRLVLRTVMIQLELFSIMTFRRNMLSVLVGKTLLTFTRLGLWRRIMLKLWTPRRVTSGPRGRWRETFLVKMQFRRKFMLKLRRLTFSVFGPTWPAVLVSSLLVKGVKPVVLRVVILPQTVLLVCWTWFLTRRLKLMGVFLLLRFGRGNIQLVLLMSVIMVFLI